MIVIRFIFIVSFLSSFTSFACMIAGTDSGECLDPADFADFMPFCGSLVKYRTCVPKYDELHPDHTILAKDKWVEEQFNAIVAERLMYEDENGGVNEHGVEGETEPRFSESDDCINAYKNWFCWSNFPRCDDEDQSLLLCESVCENFYATCDYVDEMMRCGPSQYHNHYFAETTEVTDDEGQPQYMRYFVPGQPFQANSFDGGDPRAVCTPSIANPASVNGVSLILAVISAIVSIICFF
eukprot:TRINITY_DN773059_c0_g1_i1.p1 TRINITY_DN773059_c0_g1~~TRINITY_DN773059_c0_g1_i1.p1  ORF type:complete len:239 (-),score=34.60 TRINITY_DN773059_c0_g1_i1:80-796(-)